MHHVVLDRWSRGASFLHRRDARAKMLALLALLVSLATAGRSFAALGIVYFGVLCILLVAARVPLWPALKRAAVVLPFSLLFAAVSIVSGDTARAAVLLVKSYVSALGVLLLVSTTPLPELLRGLEFMAVPGFLLMVIQFLYRYLFVISEEAQHMRSAAQARSGSIRNPGFGRSHFRAAAGALGVLFARSYSHAEGIHQAMLARGFQGHFRTLSEGVFGRADAAFLIAALAVLIGLRVTLELWI